MRRHSRGPGRVRVKTALTVAGASRPSGYSECPAGAGSPSHDSGTRHMTYQLTLAACILSARRTPTCGREDSGATERHLCPGGRSGMGGVGMLWQPVQ